MTGDDSVVVVGGGLAGLVTARRLAESGIETRLFERRTDVGGRVRTLRQDGFVLDRGFQVLFDSYPAAKRELDLDALDLRRFAPGACLARPGTRSLLSDPLREWSAATNTLFNTEIRVRDKLLVLRLRRTLARRSFDDAFFETELSVREYLSEFGFSAAFIERFAAPFYGGITLDRSLGSSAGLFEYTFKALSEGSAAVPARGMDAIPEQLADRAREAGVRIETRNAVRSIESARDGATVELPSETIDADAVVVATDPPTARELTGVESIPTDGVGCVTQYYALPGPELDVGKHLVLNAAGADPNHVVPHSAVAPEQTPDERILLSAVYLGDRDEPDERLAEMTREALSAWFPERSFEELSTIHTERIPFAQFAQPPGSHADLPTPRAPDGRCYLAGEYTSWSSIQGALESGYAASQAVRAELQ